MLPGETTSFSKKNSKDHKSLTERKNDNQRRPKNSKKNFQDKPAEISCFSTHFSVRESTQKWVNFAYISKNTLEWIWVQMTLKHPFREPKGPLASYLSSE